MPRSCAARGATALIASTASVVSACVAVVAARTGTIGSETAVKCGFLSGGFFLPRG